MTIIRTLCLIVATAAATNLAWSQKGPTVNEAWAVPPGMNSGQAQSVLEGLDTPVSGRPFSATAIAHTTHTLDDGTHIDETTTTVMYRDAQGRRRTESGGIINIADNVANVGLRLNTAENVAVRFTPSSFVVNWDQVSRPAPPVATTGGKKKKNRMTPAQSGPAPTNMTEDLGAQMVNGVQAYGSRTRLVIPVGRIGNDREIVVTQETWTSPDLHVLVKSDSYDPRFGHTTFNLTNIVQALPAAVLFQTNVPSGYTVIPQQTLTAK